MKVQLSSCRRSGFALIATISMLLLLTVIAVAFLSLSTMTVKSARNDWALEEARANARLALMVAIGELQRELGPDQRVSANASIFDSTPDREDITGVDEPNWVGVWSTRWEDDGTEVRDKEDRSPWTRDDNKGGLKDRRYQTGEWDRERQVRTYLVSGNEGGGQYSGVGREIEYDAVDEGVGSLGEDEKVDLVSDQQVSRQQDEVSVRKVKCSRYARRASGQRAPTEMGSYGYWIGDLGARANISVPDEYESVTPNESKEEGFERLLYSQDASPEYVDGFQKIDATVARKLVSPETLEFTGVSKDDLRDNFHAFTTHSQSVMSNTRDGGLQKDLDAYLQLGNSEEDISDFRRSSEIHYLGIDDDDQLVGFPNEDYKRALGSSSRNYFLESSPRFEIMRNWMRDAETQNLRIDAPDVDLRRGDVALLPEVDEISARRWIVFDGLLGGVDPAGRRSEAPGTNNAPPGGGKSGETNYPIKFTRLADVSMAPVVTEASLYYNIAAVPVTGPDAQGEQTTFYQNFLCTYPRVALWNPYNVDLEVPPLIVHLFLNGNKLVEMTLEDGTRKRINIPYGKRYGGSGLAEAEILPFRAGLGQTFWFLANDQSGRSVTIPPGKTVVFSADPARSSRGNGNYSSSNFTRNLLTPRGRMNAAQDFYWEEMIPGRLSGNGFQRDKEHFKSRPVSYREVVERDAKQSGADNYQFIVKYLPGGRGYGQGLHGILPFCEDWQLLTYANISLQAGGSDELPLEWDRNDIAYVHRARAGGGGIQNRLTRGAGSDLDPHTKSRDGFRMRWYREHQSNLGGSRRLGTGDMTKLFHTAHVANWNMRSTFVVRTPFENLTEQPPYFFGHYTRDLFDQEVSFESMTPTRVRGQMTGSPFFSPEDSAIAPESIVLFEMPSEEIGIPSLAYLRNLKLSELAWTPSYPIANSLAEPRMDPQQTAIDRSRSENRTYGGWNRRTMGQDPDRGRGGTNDYWAELILETLDYVPETNHVAFDMSYEVNHNLWDTYFMSTGDEDRKTRFAQNPVANPLPNGRFRAYGKKETLATSLKGKEAFFLAASQLMLDGGFNVNSTNKNAWKAVLSATAGASINGGNGVSFPRFLSPPGEDNDDASLSDDSYTGNRVLEEKEIDRLAEEIVSEVKLRAPFFGLSDFVNRRLKPLTDSDLTARCGPIEEAIYKSGVNAGMDSAYEIDRKSDIGNVRFDRNLRDSTKLNHQLKPPSRMWGMPGYLTQGDVLGVIGSTLRARSDSFVVRCYGDSKNVNGEILARAWCEAVVQRTPEPVHPDEYGLNPERLGEERVRFGRRFQIVSFRWLNKAEV